ncbi:hypothetical protein EPUS_06202 [Endocarpon pusillum Z07020]|uniref:SWR1-complex protein 4 n=1 Tax=Endocarpon pusillum (strain Z07020 / HMAS-L-300199) TaxID=1263415 RepID=U1GC70_ENDPU|nr:uncharacterized protein EPUS_06202 [Endocarpon pusillum Z07020]ERF75162.1 hypothetical protein EPUS_06202 [Endocarpon pusillum Z07020]
MATAGDIREIMDIPQEGPPKPPPKKVRVDPGPRLTGFQREVQSLMSDSHNVPPIPIVDNSRYKAKPTYAPRAFKTRKWEERRFVNGARTDGLELRHWKHAISVGAGKRLLEASANGTNVIPDGGSQTMGQPTPGNEENVGTQPTTAIRYDDEFPMEKFNVKVSVPSYTPEQYEAHFKSEEWTKEETDYLMDLCRNFDMRWIVVADRYEPSEIPVSAQKAAARESKNLGASQTYGEASGDAMAIDHSSAPAGNSTSDNKNPSTTEETKPFYPQRALESLKARYYTIASKMLSINTPPDTMTPSEFGLWEKMKNFDSRTEELRKNLAEKLFLRTKEEADEERSLLEELARITKNEEEFLKMRKDLYQRLETPVLSRRAEDQGTAALYQSSQGLGHLLSNLLNREKRFKRPGMIDTGRANSTQDGNGEAERGTAGTATDRPRKQTWEKGQHPNQYTARRNTMDSESVNGDAPKKTGSMAQTPNVRNLTPAEEAKYGVAHPQERITSGVQFRHEKASKVVLSKSAAQMAKIQAALVELGIPVRLLMPTERVCREYERLVADIVLLLDARRGVERVSSEVKVLEESRRMRLGLPKEDQDGGDGGDKMDVDQDSKAQHGGEGKQDSVQEQQNANFKPDPEAEAEAEDSDGNADVAPEGDEDVVTTRTEVNPENEKSGENMGAEDNRDDDEDDEGSSEGEAAEADENASESEAEAENDDGDGDAEVEAQEDDNEEEEEDDEEEDERAATPSPDNDGNEAEEEDEASEAESDAPEADQAVGEDEAEEEQSEAKTQQPPAVPARLHKRSASVISDGSRAGSNRSGVGRKKGRR